MNDLRVPPSFTPSTPAFSISSDSSSEYEVGPSPQLARSGSELQLPAALEMIELLLESHAQPGHSQLDIPNVNDAAEGPIDVLASYKLRQITLATAESFRTIWQLLTDDVGINASPRYDVIQELMRTLGDLIQHFGLDHRQLYKLIDHDTFQTLLAITALIRKLQVKLWRVLGPSGCDLVESVLIGFAGLTQARRKPEQPLRARMHGRPLRGDNGRPAMRLRKRRQIAHVSSLRDGSGGEKEAQGL